MHLSVTVSVEVSVELSAEVLGMEVLHSGSCNETAEGFPGNTISFSVEVDPGLSSALLLLSPGVCGVQRVVIPE